MESNVEATELTASTAAPAKEGLVVDEFRAKEGRSQQPLLSQGNLNLCKFVAAMLRLPPMETRQLTKVISATMAKSIAATWTFVIVQ